ncbi:hypothetical protein FB561_2178 [Kribbella amoyensis]|uniref:Uncharacterized protein n=1 Tax=Kribbella amoyensis TaxID=996641 RepID=A0A561BQG3_9ACTN|nr:hypothetical protein [Kribbella amoyensis]TWD81074.1 hypothetical protein FB561_2178 [Kribbella amoyensis]
MRVLPTTYQGQRTDRFRYYVDLRSGRPRDDPWPGQPVQPEACRNAIRTSGLTTRGIDGFRSDTPAVTANLMNRDGEIILNVRVYEMTGAELVRYQLQLPRPFPECREFTVGSAGRGSILERPLKEFGPNTRYVIRTFPQSGRPMVERVLQLQTPHFGLDVRLYSADVTEREFLAFARQTRAQVLRKLG